MRNLTFTDVGARGDEHGVLRNFSGRAIVNYGSLVVSRCTFENNFSAYGYAGAAIANYGGLNIEDSYFARNWTGRGPGLEQLPLVVLSTMRVLRLSRTAPSSRTFQAQVEQSPILEGCPFIRAPLPRIAQEHIDCFHCGGAISNGGLMHMGKSAVYANGLYGIVNHGTATIISSTIAERIRRTII